MDNDWLVVKDKERDSTKKPDWVLVNTLKAAKELIETYALPEKPRAQDVINLLDQLATKYA